MGSARKKEEGKEKENETKLFLFIFILFYSFLKERVSDLLVEF